MSIREYWILLLVLISFSCNNVKEVITPDAPTSEEVYPTDKILQAEEYFKIFDREFFHVIKIN